MAAKEMEQRSVSMWIAGQHAEYQKQIGFSEITIPLQNGNV